MDTARNADMWPGAVMQTDDAWLPATYDVLSALAALTAHSAEATCHLVLGVRQLACF